MPFKRLGLITLSALTLKHNNQSQWLLGPTDKIVRFIESD